MPRGRGKGGYQPPAQPAAVSGPGAASARTDSPATQPIRVASGGNFGDRQALVAQQQAAPLAAAGSTPTPPAGPAAAPYSPVDVYAPTNNPDQPLTAGAEMGPGVGAPNPNDPIIDLVAALYQANGTDDLRDVLEELQANQ